MQAQMKNILIADAGSSKTDWAFICPDEGIVRFKTPGLNALLATDEELADAFRHVNACLPGSLSRLSSTPFPSISTVDIPEPTHIDVIYYYGAGCATESVCRKTRKALSEAFDAVSVFVASDLLGAARSLLGNDYGIACILGTGSNSCLYDGRDIVRNVPALGFILGDEGSGASLGKRLVGNIYKGLWPDRLKQEFLAEYGFDVAEILNNVYRRPNPNRFLASLVPFLSSHRDSPHVYEMVRKEFLDFLTRNVLQYPEARNIPICFTGSVATVFEDILKEAAAEAHLIIGRVSASPMEGLIAFHSN